MKYEEWQELSRGLKKIYYSKNFLESEEVIRSWFYSLRDFETEYVRKACRAYYDSEKGKKFYPRLNELMNYAEHFQNEDSSRPARIKYAFGNKTLQDCYRELNALRNRLKEIGIELH